MTEDHLPCGHEPDSSFESQYKRVFEAARCATRAQLADVLDVRLSSLSDAQRRGMVPPQWLVTLLEKKRINPEWIRTGTGAKYLRAADNGHCMPHEHCMPHVVRLVEIRPPSECSAQDLINELVRRAMKSVDAKAKQPEAAHKEAAAPCTPAKKKRRGP